MTLTSMRRFTSPGRAAVMAAVASVTAGGTHALPAGAQAPPPLIVSEPLTPRSVFVDDIGLKVQIKLAGEPTTVVNVKDPSSTVVVRYTVQPGAQFPGIVILARWSSTSFQER